MGAVFQKAVARNFDKGALNYDRLAVVQKSVAGTMVERASTYIKAAKDIVDLGCGSGYVLSRCRQLNDQASLTAVDIAPAMLDLVAARSISSELFLADLVKTPIDDASFDLVLSTSAMQWVDISKAIQEVHRLTRVGGHAVVSFYLKDTLKEWRQLWGVDEGNMSSRQQLQDALGETGLSVISMDEQVLTQRCGSFSEALSSVRDLGAGGRHKADRGLLGRRRFLEIKGRVEGEILKKGFFAMNYHAVHFVAQKIS